MGNQYDLRHPTLHPEYQPTANVGTPGAMMTSTGNLDDATTQVDNTAFWSNVFGC